MAASGTGRTSRTCTATSGRSPSISSATRAGRSSGAWRRTLTWWSRTCGPPVKDRLGVDYDTLRAVNPRLVYARISGFGQDGPYAARGGVDQIAQGLGGLMSVTGLPGQGPVRVGVPISDLAAGVYLALGIIVALHERERTGEGRWVQTSLLEAMVAMLDFQAARWTMCGEVAGQEGNDHPTDDPHGLLPYRRRPRQHRRAAGACGGVLPGHRRTSCWPTPLRHVPAALQRPGRAQRPHRRGAGSPDHGPLGGGAEPGRGPVRPRQQHRPDLRRPPGAPSRAWPRRSSIRPSAPVDRPQRPQPERHRPGPAGTAPESGQHTDEVLAELGLGSEQVADLRGRAGCDPAAPRISTSSHRNVDADGALKSEGMSSTASAGSPSSTGESPTTSSATTSTACRRERPLAPCSRIGSVTRPLAWTPAHRRCWPPSTTASAG